MMDHIFRQNDIRAKIGPELAIQEVYDLTRVIAAYLIARKPTMQTVAVGADGRIHSPAIKKEMCRALQDAGLDVLFIGVCPTPALYFALHTLAVDAGLMITASHNGKEYNGIKMCLGKETVWGNDIQEILDRYKQKKMNGVITRRGSYQEVDLVASYVAWLKNSFSDLIGLSESYVIDCGNGAAGTVLPQLVEAFSWKQVSLLYPEVDGTYPNHEADPTVPKNMAMVKQILATTDISCGLGLDGDCDRMSPMTKNGRLVPGDMLLVLFAQDLLTRHPGATIVFDVKCSALLPTLIKQWGGVPIMAPSGHSIIKNRMKESGALLGGELSCHFFFKEGYFGYDDGIYAALRLMRLIKNSECSLDELLGQLPPTYSTPEARLVCPEEDKVRIVEEIKKGVKDYYPQAEISALDGIRVTLPFGWFIVRASNTQSAICVRAEADSPESLAQIVVLLQKLMKQFFLPEVLEREFNL